MSNVTPAEILSCVAGAWGMPIKAICGTGKAVRPPSAALFARSVTAYLIRRHTSASGSEICKTLNLSYGSEYRAWLEKASDTVALGVTFDGVLRRRLADAEARIDEIHERRTDERWKRIEQRTSA